MATARLEAILGLNTKGFEKGLARARASANEFAKKGLTVLAAAATAAGVALAAGTKRIIGVGAELKHLSDSTGIAVSDLAVLRRAFEDNGISAESVATTIGKMQRTIVEAGQGLTTYQRAFDSIGLSWTELLKLSPAAQFGAISDALASMPNPTERAAAAMQIFGRAGAKLGALFQSAGAIEDARKSLGAMPGTLEDMAVTFERIDTILGRLPDKTDQFFAGFASRVGPQLLDPLEKANEQDFTQLGESLGAAVAPLVEALKGDEAWELFAIGARKAVLGFVGLVADAASEIGALIASTVAAGFDVAYGKITSMLSGASFGLMKLPEFGPGETTFEDAFARRLTSMPKSNWRQRLPGTADADWEDSMYGPTQRAYRNTAAALLGEGSGGAAPGSNEAVTGMARNIEAIKNTLEYMRGQVEFTQ